MTQHSESQGREPTLTGHQLDMSDETAVMAFIRENTKIIAPPLVPEITLYLAEESLPIWQKTEEQLQQQNIPPPFWAFAWAGGQALARYLFDHRSVIAGKRVLDIGTGSGITAIAAKLCGAASVTAADVDPFSVIATKLNAELNGCAISVTGKNVLTQEPNAHDVYIIADLFYERALADQALTFAKAAKQNGALVFVGDPKRSYFPVADFSCLETYEVAVTRELEDALIKKTSVWQI